VSAKRFVLGYCVVLFNNQKWKQTFNHFKRYFKGNGAPQHGQPHRSLPVWLQMFKEKEWSWYELALYSSIRRHIISMAPVTDWWSTSSAPHIFMDYTRYCVCLGHSMDKRQQGVRTDFHRTRLTAHQLLYFSFSRYTFIFAVRCGKLIHTATAFSAR